MLINVGCVVTGRPSLTCWPVSAPVTRATHTCFYDLISVIESYAQVAYPSSHLLLQYTVHSNNMSIAFRPLVISGPSGGGKSTVLKRAMQQYPDAFAFSVSREHVRATGAHTRASHRYDA